MIKRGLSVAAERWPLAAPFATSSGVYDSTDLIVATVTEDGHIGQGEAAGVWYMGETPASMIAQIESVRGFVEGGGDRADLQRLLPAGGARNALDCALWALEARSQGGAFTGRHAAPYRTALTISLDTPAAMARAATARPEFSLLKLKLNATAPIARVEAVRAARPAATLICDVNGGWSLNELRDFAPRLLELGVRLIEQPVPRGEDQTLASAQSPIALAADESCADLADLKALPGGYDFVCIKLDKSGGLTEALAMADLAEALGLRLMVSNMIGTSLAIAPASLLARRCEYVDLDGPLLLARDRSPGMELRGDVVQPFGPEIWA